MIIVTERGRPDAADRQLLLSLTLVLMYHTLSYFVPNESPCMHGIPYGDSLSITGLYILMHII